MIALREAVAPYATEGLSTRAHVALRWVSCPFERVLDALPDAGDVLDVGCGHGVLDLALANRSNVAVTGVDIDDDKLAIAKRVAGRTGGGRVRFERAGRELPAGTWDAVVLVDVLYLMPHDEQRRLLVTLAGKLRPGGSIVVKEMDTKPRWKAAWMRAQERVAVRALHITAGGSLVFTDPGAIVEALREAGLETSVRRIDRWYPHPHVLVIGTKV